MDSVGVEMPAEDSQVEEQSLNSWDPESDLNISTENDKYNDFEDPLSNESFEARFARLYYLPLSAKESTKWKLISFVNFVLSIWCGVGSLCILVMYKNTDRYLRVLESYDNGHLVVILAMIGATACLTFLFGSLTSWVASTRSKRGGMRYLIYVYLGWATGLMFTSIASLIVCAVVFSLVSRIFSSGFIVMMQKYKNDLNARELIHSLQADNRCCGNSNYTEWFSIDFSGEYRNTDIGFPSSCCDSVQYSKKDCVSKAAFAQANVLTPYKLGCLNILKTMYQSILKYLLAIFSVVIFGDCLGLWLTVSNMQPSKFYDDFMASEKEILLSLKFRQDKIEKNKKAILHDIPQPSDAEELMNIEI